MGNRKQPFGYKMEFGEIVPQPQEAETIRSIYLQYLAGASFKQLTEQLQAEDVPYDVDKPWNKNMVVSQFELEFNSCFRWLIFPIGNFNRCSLVRNVVSCTNPFSADVIFTVYRIFDLDSMRKGCAIHRMNAGRFTIHF